MGKRLTVLGAGSWGTALALQAAKNGCDTLLWGHDPAHIQKLASDRANMRYLPDIPFPKNLQLTANLEQATHFSQTLLIVVPSHAFKTTLEHIKPFLSQTSQIAWATKGFNPKDGSLLHQLVEQVLSPTLAKAVLSGPTFAREVALGLPTAVTIASDSAEFSDHLSLLLHNPSFRIYTSTDIIGVEIGGAVKNVLAIAAGIADGLGFGANTRSALITRGLNEMIRLGLKLNGQPDTFMGLAGLGDLILTCTDDQSRNRRLGLALGKGVSRQDALEQIQQHVEGVSAAQETWHLAQKLRVEMPITEQTYRVLYENLDPKQAVHNLLTREQKAEIAG
ncbi:NAD(P)H-dependent glycerol-3-phosphate dehydrogenase [methane-oxidizing endosymbiont of Gigantopelta aegis]|uniref:NAD(P)H-dependent glycerol-3-phosphate dehydrogenase n=1 Tax=methane-oxidizing endosymbiont of Gigantopelta aegis TaxID=2794938 RepID=UPI0018DC7B2F|nr:NAD(P)H-dependent glycerol-3-phosphate dehydrogenase [methane-oxidizing endosymbiont of Gigantopelta aegis]